MKIELERELVSVPWFCNGVEIVWAIVKEPTGWTRWYLKDGESIVKTGSFRSEEVLNQRDLNLEIMPYLTDEEIQRLINGKMDNHK